MKLYVQIVKLLFNKFILRKNNGLVIKKFSQKMGVVYIKLTQILATQNYGDLFTEDDRKMLSSICDDCNPISYDEIEKILNEEYGTKLYDIFSYIEKQPVGSASVSQVHRAILKTGEEVAIKIRRRDVTKTIDRDIKRIRKIVHRFGKFVNISNITGGDHALDLYLEWIKQETDFRNEIENIKTYQNFASSVNGKVRDTKKIKVPKLYEEYCTDNIIIMEFIKSKTINKMELDSKNKKVIANAINSYIKLSFYAMFNDKQIVFHGDPHSGNICIDENGNICFLDMGLLCALSDSDAKMCRDFFLTVYSGNYEKMYNMLINYGDMCDLKREMFKKDLMEYCKNIKGKEVTCYFIDMVNICLKYEFVPPNFLFSMAKAFVCLNGISNFSSNKCSAIELVQEQVVQFMVKLNLSNCKNLAITSLNIVPKALKNTLKYGITDTITKVATNGQLRENIRETLDGFKEMLTLIRVNDDIKLNKQDKQKQLKY